MSLFSLALDALNKVGGVGASVYHAVTPDPVEDKLAHYVGAPIASTMAFDRQLYSDYVSRPVSTALLLSNPSSSGFANPGEAWRVAANVSPGQAATANPFAQIAKGAVDPWQAAAVNAAVATTPGLREQSSFGLGFDPASPEAQALFHGEGTANLAANALTASSGATDFALNYYADPLNAAGMVAGQAYRGAANIDRLGHVDESARVASVIDETGALRTSGPVDQPIAAMLTRRAKETSPDRLMVETDIAKSNNPVALARAYADAPDEQAVAAIYLASRENYDALRWLDEQHASIAETLRSSSMELNALKDDYEALSPAFGFDPRYGTNLAEQARLEKVVADAAEKDAWLSAALSQDNQLYGAASTYGVARSAKIDALRQKWGDTRYDITRGYSAVHYGKYRGGAVKVIRWMGGYSPNGRVALSGMDQRQAGREILATLQDAKAAPDQIEYWMNQWARAGNEQQRIGVLHSMEHNLVEKTFNDFHLDPVEGKRLLDQTQQARTQLQQEVLRKGFGVDADGSLIVTKQIETQLANSMAVLDFRVLRAALRKTANRSAAKEGVEWAGTKAGLQSGIETLDTGLAAFNQLWKPAVLLRLGYTGRNVGESQIAAFVRTQFLVGDPVTGTKNVTLNMVDRAKRIKPRIQKESEAALKRDLDEQVANMAQNSLHYKAQLDDLNTQITEHAAEMAAIEKAAAGAEPEQLVAARAAHQTMLDALEEQKRLIEVNEARFDDLRTQLERTAQKKAKPRRQNTGTRRYGTVNGAPVVLDEALGGSYREVAEAAFSGEATQQALNMGAQSRRVNNKWLGARLGEHKSWQVEPGAANYYETLAHTVNTQFRQSPWMQQLLAGADPDDVVRWFTATPEGQNVLYRMGWHAEDVGERVMAMDDMIDRYLPDPQLRAAAAAGDITADQARARLTDRQLSTIHGREMFEVAAFQNRPLDAIVDRIYQANQLGFHALGAVPENAAARYPLGGYFYDHAMRRMLAQNQGTLEGLSHAEAERAFARMQRAARATALNETENTIYTIGHRTNAANSLRYLSPFLSVTLNRFGFYGRMAVEHPEQMARLFVGWDSLDTTTDANGNQVIAFNLPGFVADALGVPEGEKLGITKKSLNLVGQGEPWWNPGFGPPATMPTAWLIRNNKVSENWLTDFILPFGAGQGWTDQVVPSTWRAWNASHRDTPEWVNDYSMIGTQETIKWKAGLRDQPSNEEIAKRADALGFLRTAAKGTLPFSISFTGPSAVYVNEYRQMQNDDYDTADQKFLAKYPDYYDYMISFTKNRYGFTATGSTNRRIDRYSDLIASMDRQQGDPSIASLLTNDDGEYSSTAYQYQKRNKPYAGADDPIRVPVNYDTALQEREARHGWLLYNQLDAVVKQQLADRGLTNIQQSGAEDLALMRRMAVQNIAKQYPSWYQAFNSRDGAYYAGNAASFTVLLQDPRVYTDEQTAPWATQAKQYIEFRSMIVNELLNRQKNGFSASWDAKANLDLKALWNVYTRKLSESSPAWADVFARYFENDNLLPAYER